MSGSRSVVVLVVVVDARVDVVVSDSVVCND